MQPSQSPKPVAPIRSADTYSPRHSAVTTETKGVISRCQVGPSQAVIVVPDRVDTAKPTIIESLNEDFAVGLSLTQIGLVTAIPSLCGVIAMILWGRRSDRKQERIWHLVIPSVLGAVAIVSAGYANSLPLAVLAFSITSACIFSATPIFWQLPSRYLTGLASAAAIGMINAMGNFSGLIGPSITGVLRDQTGSYSASLWVMGGFLVLAAVGTVILARIVRTPAIDASPDGSSTIAKDARVTR